MEIDVSYWRRILDRGISRLEQLNVVLCQALLVVQIVVVSYVVFGRFVLNSTPAWGEALSKLCMVWFTFLSIAFAVKSDSHIRLAALDLIFPLRIRRILYVASGLLVATVAAFFVVQGLNLMELTWTSRMPGLRIPRAWLYVSLPVAGVMILVTLSGKLVRPAGSGWPTEDVVPIAEGLSAAEVEVEEAAVTIQDREGSDG